MLLVYARFHACTLDTTLSLRPAELCKGLCVPVVRTSKNNGIFAGYQENINVVKGA